MSAVKAELTEQQSIVTTESEYWRPAIGRIADSSRAIDSVLASRLDGVRGYPRHARSLSARALRQRVLLLAAVLATAAVASVVAIPRAFHHNFLARHKEASSLPLGAATLARDEAASWIRDWVSISAVVACDPLMCRALASHGVATVRMQQIGTNAEDFLSADVVVATPVIRNQFGARLAQVYAPGVLARFGAGTARVDVRVVVNGGAAGQYLRQLHADVGVRRAAGLALLDNPDVVATGLVARQMAAGAVDSRLLTNLATLVHWSSPVAVVSVGGSGPGATPGMPLLSMSVTPMVRRSGVRLVAGHEHPGWAAMRSVIRVTARAAARIMTFLRVQRTPLQPARCREVRLANGRIVIEIDFGAPTQFGVFSGSLPGTTPVGDLQEKGQVKKRRNEEL